MYQNRHFGSNMIAQRFGLQAQYFFPTKYNRYWKFSLKAKPLQYLGKVNGADIPFDRLSGLKSQ